jgi:hypothetical protein
MKPIPTAEAEARNLRPLTSGYLSNELWMLENVCADMRRGGIAHAIVETKHGLEVWRSNCGFKEASK